MMMNEKNQPNGSEGSRWGIGSLFRDLGASAKNMVFSEIELAIAEVKQNLTEMRDAYAKLAFFSVLAAFALVPFQAFLILGLGDLMGQQYWLSALIVTAAFALGGGIPAYYAYQKILAQDFKLKRTADTIEAQKRVLQDQAENLKDVTNATLRRAV
ncbi:MAG: phage holin family protein [Proteobacteria bacterium]|nr:MAG: phage holin family protein [Pseudomonadota bacterium]